MTINIYDACELIEEYKDIIYDLKQDNIELKKQIILLKNKTKKYYYIMMMINELYRKMYNQSFNRKNKIMTDSNSLRVFMDSCRMNYYDLILTYNMTIDDVEIKIEDVVKISV